MRHDVKKLFAERTKMPSLHDLNPRTYKGVALNTYHEAVETVCKQMIEAGLTSADRPVKRSHLISQFMKQGMSRQHAYRMIKLPGFAENSMTKTIYFEADLVEPYAKQQACKYYPRNTEVFTNAPVEVTSTKCTPAWELPEDEETELTGILHVPTYRKETKPSKEYLAEVINRALEGEQRYTAAAAAFFASLWKEQNSVDNELEFD